MAVHFPKNLSKNRTLKPLKTDKKEKQLIWMLYKRAKSEYAL